jgi:WD40 repeat protein
MYARNGGGMPKKVAAATDAVLRVAYKADGQHLATASAGGTIKLWSAIDGSAIANLPPHEKAARCVTFNYDSSLVVSAGEDGIVRITCQKSSSAPFNKRLIKAKQLLPHSIRFR